jgi:hypothetical protein
MGNYMNHGLHNVFQKSLYQEKIAKDEREMAYISELEADAEKRTNEQMEQQAQVSNYMDAIDAKIGQLLPEDVDRVKALEQQARQMVISGVASAQGDYKQFMLRGGSQVLRDYKKSVLDSDEVANAVKNKDNYMRIKEDMSKGKLFHDVMVEYTQGGQTVQEAVDVNTMMELFENNQILNIDYRGAEEAVDIKPMDFFKNFHPKSPFESKRVTYEDIREFAIAKGQSPDIAEKIASKMISHEEGGVPYTDMWWGIKDDDFTGTGRRWGSNGRNKSGAAKFLPALEMMQSMEPTSQRQLADWTTRDGKTKARMTIDGYNPGNDALDAIKGHLGLILNRDGSYSGSIDNSIGFFNMDNGRSQSIKASDYELVGTGNEVQITRDAETGESQMFMPVTIRVSEDYMEEHMGEGAWWNGWTTESNEWGNVTRDKDYKGEDMREIQVSVSIPMDEMNRERINQKIGMKEGTVIGGMGVEDYYSARVSAPQGGQKPPAPEVYKNLNGSVFGTTSSKFEGSEADRFMSLSKDAERRIRNNPQYSQYSDEEIATFAKDWALKNL